MKEPKNVAVLGTGSWGTAVAHHLAKAGHHVIAWGKEAPVVRDIAENNRNEQFFPGLTFGARFRATENLAEAVKAAHMVVFAVPADAVREVCVAAKSSLRAGVILVNTAKGIETTSQKLMSEVLQEEAPDGARISVVSGPSFALELIQGKPTAVVAAGTDIEVAEQAAKFFHFDYLRVYSSTDIIGVQLGGVLKNIIAIAVGAVDGKQLGDNARAALLTRGLLEMQRFVVACGGDAKTVTGLSGLGDLLLTATGDLSRNRRVGMALGRGAMLQETLQTIGQVAEGVRSHAVVLEIAKKHGISVPIMEEIHRLLSSESTVDDALTRLFSRVRRTEMLM